MSTTNVKARALFADLGGAAEKPAAVAAAGRRTRTRGKTMR